ncbi:MAG: hypothetical protein AAGD25_02595 [Cyanobacteria bacterium P01_F01_bin.150]
MMATSKTFKVPIIGGHPNVHSPYEALSVEILSRAKRLITSFNAQPGDVRPICRAKSTPRNPSGMQPQKPPHNSSRMI